MQCTIYKTANFIGKKWTLLILLELYKGNSKWKRYSQIKSNIPSITPKMLSMRLKELKKENLIKKRVDISSSPIRSEYSLTKSGNEFIKVIKEIKKWSLEWKFDNKVCSGSDCKYCKI